MTPARVMTTAMTEAATPLLPPTAVGPVAIAVGNGAPRDVRLAVAILICAARSVAPGGVGGLPVQLSFTSYEEDFEAMQELCMMAAWKPEKFSHMQKTLREVASQLANWRYLESSVRTCNEEAMEFGEPTRWNVYSAPLKYRARLNPSAWSGYTPDWTPVEELAFLLRRVFGYEGTVQEWRDSQDDGGVDNGDSRD